MTRSVSIKTAYKEFEPKTEADPKLPPLIFLHGLTSSKEHWDDIPQKIADYSRRKAYALDARNHGDSEWSEEFDEDLLVEDLFNFMDSMRIPRAVLIGHSMGGRTAVKAALRKPEKFEMLFIEECNIKALTPERLKELLFYLLVLEEAVSSIPLELDEVAASKFIRNYLHSKMPLLRQAREPNYLIPMKRDLEGRHTLKLNLKALISSMKSPKAPANTTEDGAFEDPAYFIYGTESRFGMFEEEDQIRRYFPKMQLIGIEGAGHDLHGEFPEKFTETVLKCFGQM